MTALESVIAKLEASQSCERPPLASRRLMILGDPGVGKTWLMASCPRALLIDIDDGSRDVPAERMRAARLRVKSYTDLLGVLRALEMHAGALNLATDPIMVVFDTFDRMVPLVMGHLSETIATNVKLMTSPKGYEETPGLARMKITDWRGGKGGWNLVNNTLAEFPRRLYDVGYGVTLLVHLKKELQEPEGGGRPLKIERLAIAKGCRDLVTTDQELIARFEVRQGIKPGGTWVTQRILTTAQSVADEATQDYKLKCRLQIPEEVDVSEGWAALEQAYLGT